MFLVYAWRVVDQYRDKCISQIPLKQNLRNDMKNFFGHNISLTIWNIWVSNDSYRNYTILVFHTKIHAFSFHNLNIVLCRLRQGRRWMRQIWTLNMLKCWMYRSHFTFICYDNRDGICKTAPFSHGWKEDAPWSKDFTKEWLIPAAILVEVVVQ